MDTVQSVTKYQHYKGQQGKKKFFPVLTEEEKIAAKKWKYDKNKERNKQRKLEAVQRRAAHAEARAKNDAARVAAYHASQQQS